MADKKVVKVEVLKNNVGALLKNKEGTSTITEIEALAKSLDNLIQKEVEQLKKENAFLVRSVSTITDRARVSPQSNRHEIIKIAQHRENFMRQLGEENKKLQEKTSQLKTEEKENKVEEIKVESPKMGKR